MERPPQESLFQDNPKELLFRSSALDRLSAREELDELFLPVLPWPWLTWLAAALLLSAAVILLT